jgi:predicted membrane channel-forming protein YqfA (hemolysin III family)
MFFVAVHFRELIKAQDDEQLDNMDYYAHSMRIAVITGCIYAPMGIGIFMLPTPYRVLATLGVIVFLSIGGVFYANKIPEKWYPNRNICCGHSNHIMHLCIILAHICNYMYVAY